MYKRQELDGTAHRHLQDNQRGAHTGGRNTGNIAIGYGGGLAADGRTPKATRTPQQKEALRRLVASYRARFPNLAVKGHRDWPGVAKACPSFDVATNL